MEAKQLSDADFETGMIFERKLAAAHEAFIAANNAYLAYMEVLRERYSAPEGEYQLLDWADGFVPVGGDNGE